VEYFLKALEEIYAVSEVDKFARAEGVWRAVMSCFQKSLRVDASDAGALSLSFTAVLVETNQKHPLPRVFTSTSNVHGKSDAMSSKNTSARIRIIRRSGPYVGLCECARGQSSERRLTTMRWSAEARGRTQKLIRISPKAACGVSIGRSKSRRVL
jgi:hypothetical protein